MTREEFRLYLLEPKIDQACASPEHDTNIPHKRKDSRREDLGIEYLACPGRRDSLKSSRRESRANRWFPSKPCRGEEPAKSQRLPCDFRTTPERAIFQTQVAAAGSSSCSEHPYPRPPPIFFFSSRRRHTRLTCDWSSDVCSSD